MMMSSVMENFQHLTQDCPNAEGHLLVALPGQPLDRFEVTEVIRQGTSLVLQCQPVEKENDSEPPSPRDDSDNVFITVWVVIVLSAGLWTVVCAHWPIALAMAGGSFITDGDAEPLTLHDPRRFYEDLR